MDVVVPPAVLERQPLEQLALWGSSIILVTLETLAELILLDETFIASAAVLSAPVAVFELSTESKFKAEQLQN